MALKQNVNTEFGFEIQEAYQRVEDVVLVEKVRMQFMVRTYKNPTAKSLINSVYSCAYDLTLGNPYEQAYAYLKTQDEFKNAVDC